MHDDDDLIVAADKELDVDVHGQLRLDLFFVRMQLKDVVRCRMRFSGVLRTRQ